MFASKASVSLVLTLVCFVPVAAIHIATPRIHARNAQGAVCISVTAYEDPVWIDILLRNALRFTDCSTKIALHLDNGTNYSSADIDKFGKMSNRVSLNPERIGVKWNTGSILHAHVLNAVLLQKTWGNECSYWVLQESNMLWLKPGMESYIHEFRISGMSKRGYGACDKFCAWKGWSEDDRMWEHPEGTFVPMSLMNQFTKDYMTWFDTLADPYWEFLHSGNGKEEDWLQTFVKNDGGYEPEAGPTLCERVGPEAHLDLPKVKEMVKGSLDEVYKNKYKKYYPGHEEFCNRTEPRSMAPFAVKVKSVGGPCVTRDPNSDVAKWLDLTSNPYEDAVIKYILQLTDRMPMFIGSCRGAA